MPVVTQEDFMVWIKEPMTVAFFNAAKTRRELTKENLCLRAGLDSATDNYLRGMIGTYDEILSVEFGEVEKDSNND